MALLVGALTAGALWTARTDPRDTTDPQLEDLYPLDLGTTWVYRTLTDGEDTGLSVVQIVGGTLFLDLTEGVVARTTYEDFLGTGSAHETWTYLSALGGQVLVHGERAAGEHQEIAPPRVALRAPLREGASWTWLGQQGTTPSRSISSVLGTESVTVAGREFTGCVHVRSNVTSGEGETETTSLIDAWVCPGIGLVRSEERSQGPEEFRFERELVEFHGPGGNLRASGAGLPEVEPAGTPQPGGHPGIDAAGSNHVPDARLDVSRPTWTVARRATSMYAPVGGDGIVVIASDDGTVTAIATRPGETVWQVQLDGPIVAPPVLTGSLVLVADSSKSLFALDAATGAARWAVRLPDLVSTAPAVEGTVAVVAVDDRTVRGLSLEDGRQLWQVETEALVPSPPVVVEGRLVVADLQGNIVSLDPVQGTALWNRELIEALGAPAAGGEGLVVVPQEGSVLWGLEATDGSLRWRVAGKGSIEVAPAVGGGSVVALAEFFVEARDVATGSLRWRERVSGDASDVPPVIVGDAVAVHTNTGLHLYDLDDGALQVVDLPLPQGALRVALDVPMSYADGALVVPVPVTGGWPSLILHAFDADAGPGSTPPGGVSLEGDLRVVPGYAGGPPSLGPQGLLWPGGPDGTAWLVPAVGEPRAIATSDGLVTFAVPAGETVLVPRGDELAAMPLEGGPPRWTFTTGPASPGVAPVVAGDVVVVPVPEGLIGVDLATGERLWLVELAQEGFSTPVVVPGGDVAHAVGGITVVDPATGALRWQREGFVAVGPIASDDDSLYVEALGPRGAELLALESASGRIRWRHQLSPVALVGPASGGGVVVAADASGAVTGFDASSGEELWSARIRTPLNGSPVVVGRHVAFQEMGAVENLSAREYRVTILEARTGALHAQWEFSGGLFFGGGFGYSGGRLVLPVVTSELVAALVPLEPE